MNDKQPLSVNDLLAFAVDQFAEMAWQKLGLHPDPITGEPALDLSQAKTAIDAASFLADFLLPNLDDEDKRKLQTLIADLKINFVQKSSQPGGGV
jgi:hypothetical protein